MKTQIEFVTPVFSGDTTFTVPLRSSSQEAENSDVPASAQRLFAGLADAFEWRGVPASALND